MPTQRIPPATTPLAWNTANMQATEELWQWGEKGFRKLRELISPSETLDSQGRCQEIPPLVQQTEAPSRVDVNL